MKAITIPVNITAYNRTLDELHAQDLDGNTIRLDPFSTEYLSKLENGMPKMEALVGSWIVSGIMIRIPITGTEPDSAGEVVLVQSMRKNQQVREVINRCGSCRYWMQLNDDDAPTCILIGKFTRMTAQDFCSLHHSTELDKMEMI